MKGKIQKILYATDLTANSLHALSYAMHLAVAHDARIVSLHVIEEISNQTPILLEGYIPQETLDRFLRERNQYAIEKMTRRLDRLCAAEFSEVKDCAQRVSRMVVEVGFPAEVILRKADQEGCDLIVMGTHGKGLISQTFLGSMAKRVLRRTRKPVFIIPLPEGETDLTIHDE